MKKSLKLSAAALIAALSLAFVMSKKVSATSLTGISVANPTAQSASPTVTNLTVSGTLTQTGVATFTAAPVLPVNTTTQLSVLASAVGSESWVQELVAGTAVSDRYNLAMSTKNEAGCWIYIAVTTSAAASAGAKAVN